MLDFTDKTHSLHQLIGLAHVIPEAEYVEEKNITEQAPKKTAIGRLYEVDDQEFNLLGKYHTPEQSDLMWAPCQDGGWSLLDDQHLEIVIQPDDYGYVAYLYDGAALIRELVSIPISLQECTTICEEFAQQNLELQYANKNNSWADADATPSQRNLLKKLGYNGTCSSRLQASTVIRIIRAYHNSTKRITQRQHYFLKRRGVDTSGMTKKQAMLAISEIKGQSSINLDATKM